MKTLGVIFRFFKDNLRSAVLLLIMTVVSQFSFVCIAGILVHEDYYLGAFRRIEGIENIVYYNVLSSEYREGARYEEFLRGLAEADEVEEVCRIRPLGTFSAADGRKLQVIAMPERLFVHCGGFKTAKNGFSKTGIAGDGALEIFSVGASSLPVSKLGAETTLQYSYMQKTYDVSVRLAGRFEKDALLLGMDGGGTGLSVLEMFTSYTDTVIVPDTPEVENLLNCIPDIMGRDGFFFFRDGISQQEKEALLYPYKVEGVYMETYEEIMALTQQRAGNVYRDAMRPFIYFSFIASTFLLSMTVLLTDRQMVRMAVYYLTGLGKAKGYLLLTGHFAVTELCAAAICSGLITAIMQQPASERALNVQYILFDGRSFAVLLLHMVLMLLFLAAEVWLIYHKKSFAEIRKMEARE